MSDFEDFIEFMNYARRHREPGPRKYLRDYGDPFQKYSDFEFFHRYRFSPATVKDKILPLLELDLRRPSRRGLPFAPEIMLLVTLRFYATGSFQKLDGDVMEICQQSLSRIVANMSKLLATKLKDFIKFPITHNAIKTVKQKFYEIAGFPEVIGCIDCTHIKIKNPGGTASEVYRNRNGWFSINVQAVVGPNLEFFDLVVRWPGSTHDNLIYDSSSVKERLETGALDGILLGDCGYAVSNVLLTPFLVPNSTSQEIYNKCQIKTWNTVQRAFAVWKGRFPCLQIGMGVKLETVVAVVCACATLHNMAIIFDDVFNIEEYIDDKSQEEEINANPLIENPNDNGFVNRQSLVEKFFADEYKNNL